MKRLAAIFLLCVPAIFAGCISEGNGDGIENYVKKGSRIPPFTAKNADGSDHRVSPGDFDGKRSVIVLFQSTCGDCKREMPKVYDAWEELKDESDFQMITISRGESAVTVAEYWKSFGDMPYMLDPDKSVFGKFANSYVPRIYLVGKDGKVVHMEIEKFSFATGAGLLDLINEKL